MSGRVLFCGSRNWPAFDGDTIKDAIEALPAGTKGSTAGSVETDAGFTDGPASNESGDTKR